MLQPGKFHCLPVTEQVPFGFMLGDDPDNMALLPNTSAPKDCKLGDYLDVFVYHDAEQRLVASCDQPKVKEGECASLTVVKVTPAGAFVEWGLEKDLFVPRSQQDKPMDEGLSYVVYVYQDKVTERLAGSTRLRHYLAERSEDFRPGQAVDLLIYACTPMGYKAVINNSHLGLLFRDEVFKPLQIGEATPGYIKRVRSDHKIDLCLQLQGEQARNSLADEIIDDLRAHGGISTLTDKSPADEISQRFNVSKGAYKKALGQLYRQKKINLEKSKITLLD